MSLRRLKMDEGAAARMLPARVSPSNKGSYGKVLLYAGSIGMAGAAVLCGSGAYRTGCGLVRFLSPEENRVILQTSLPEAMVSVQLSEEITGWASVIGAGPGIGRSEEAARLLYRLLEESTASLVLDADALNILAQDRSLKRLDGCGAGRPVIITPHPGEMARLCGVSVPDILGDLEGYAASFSKTHHVICVLKDTATVITDGERLIRNPSGCDGMATGGSGDVLTGIICSLIAQGGSPFEAAAAGVYIHGLAGEAACRELGARSMLAGDILRCLPRAFFQIENKREGL